MKVIHVHEVISSGYTTLTLKHVAIVSFLALCLPQVVMGRGAHITPSHTYREPRGDTEGERDLAEKLFNVTETG